jgi:RimJ/RimL family protein N-acetyltransferase
MIQFHKVILSDITHLRRFYLQSLAEFQELYIELMIEHSAIYNIMYNGNLAGYVIISSNNILVEFYIIEKFVPFSSEIFSVIISELAVYTAYCKSFDFLLLTCCLLQSSSYTPIGTLFRNYFHTQDFHTTSLNTRFATLNDYEFLLQQRDGLYETPDELDKFIRGGNIIMFFKNNVLVGCGYLIKIHTDWDYYDIGMWVNPDFRKQGFATQIISYLKHTCIENKWIPICGCAFENIASKKTLEKNGFISKHNLFEFKFQ